MKTQSNKLKNKMTSLALVGLSMTSFLASSIAFAGAEDYAPYMAKYISRDAKGNIVYSMVGYMEFTKSQKSPYPNSFFDEASGTEVTLNSNSFRSLISNTPILSAIYCVGGYSHTEHKYWWYRIANSNFKQGINTDSTFININKVNKNYVLEDAVSLNYCTKIELPKGTKSITLSGAESEYGIIASITLQGPGVDIVEDLTNSSASFLNSYKKSLETLNSFEEFLNDTQLRHLSRFKWSLQSAIKVIADKDEKILLPVTDFAVMEQNRLIMAFGSVLEEQLLNGYTTDRVNPELRNKVNNLKNFIAQIRKVYGWDRNLVGNFSKATVSAAELMNLQIQGLRDIALAVGKDNVQVYNKLQLALTTINAKARASKGGDAAVSKEVAQLAALWNSAEWQSQLEALLNAGADYEKIVQNRLRTTLTLAFALQDTYEVNFQVPAKLEKIYSKQ